MRKVFIILALCFLAVTASAQTKKTVTTRTVTTHYTAQQSTYYVGIGGGEYDYMKDSVPIDRGALGLQVGYLYSLYGDINKSFTPYVGGEATLGIDPSNGITLAAQLGAAVGVMIGSPKFRIDLRLQPQLSYFGKRERSVYSLLYSYEIEEPSIVRPNLAIRAGVWFNHLNIYLQYHNTMGAGISWRF